MNKEETKRIIKSQLLHNEQIQSAFIYGSFCENGSYNDIDIGVFTYGNISDMFSWENEISHKLENVLNKTIDLRIVNNAPKSFLYQVFKGECLFDKGDKIGDLIESTIVEQMDEEFYRLKWLKEILNDKQ